MCGFCGWINWNENKNDVSLIEAMTQTLTPRGPDQQGIADLTVGMFGHRRLSVMDPLNGMQPMTRSNSLQTYTLIYNGELYNANELRQELELAGYSFATTCDTEIVLAAYMHWEAECLYRFNGIFAFAVWESKRERLFCARDRLGVKPFFYSHINQTFVFASEIKAILTYPLVHPIVDAQGVMELLLIGPARTPGTTPFRDVFELLPGEYAYFTRIGLQKRTYWKLAMAPCPQTTEDAASEIQRLLEDITSRQLQSDVPIGFFLSGGLDSSLLTAYSAIHLKEQLHTFSIHFEEQDEHFKATAWVPEDDEPFARGISALLNTNHRTVTLEQTPLFNALHDAMQARDLPGMADIDSSLLLFCREIKKHVTVAWSGEGADEIFGGYPWFRLWSQSDLAIHDAFPWSKAISERSSMIHSHWTEQLNPLNYAQTRWQQALQSSTSESIGTEEDQRIRQITKLNIDYFMPVLLDRKDRMSMACGLEVRVPFCDHRLVELAYRLPWNVKNALQREKGILRLASKNMLPDEFVWRKKNPFPKTVHPIYEELIMNAIENLVEIDAPLFQIVDRDAVSKLIESHKSGSDLKWFGQLMNNVQWFGYLLQLNEWIKKYNVLFL